MAISISKEIFDINYFFLYNNSRGSRRVIPTLKRKYSKVDVVVGVATLKRKTRFSYNNGDILWQI